MGALYTYGVHALALHSPDWFVAENVSGLSRANGGRAFGKILSALRDPGAAALTDPSFVEFYGEDAVDTRSEVGYDLVVHLYRFEEYGLPQKRHRFLITGIRRDLSRDLGVEFKVPKPTTPHKSQQKTAREAIEMDPIH